VSTTAAPAGATKPSAWDDSGCYGVAEPNPIFGGTEPDGFGATGPDGYSLIDPEGLNVGCASFTFNADGTCTAETSTEPPHIVPCPSAANEP
jgi:hypothetical protein